MKHCKYCNQDKPFDPKAKPHTKASGFHMSKCWDCWLKWSRGGTFEYLKQKPSRRYL